MWVDFCRLWSVVCGRVKKIGSGISSSGELVPEFNYFKMFQVFKNLNSDGSLWKVAQILDVLGRDYKMVGWFRTAPQV
jgi:hypothetical protein